MKEIMERLNFKKNLDDDIEGGDDVEQKKYGRKLIPYFKHSDKK